MFANVSLQLDTRRQKANGRYPLKIRIYCPVLQKKKLYHTGIDLTEEQFYSAWQSSKPRKEEQELRIRLKKLESKAIQDAEATLPFSFEAFERRLARKVGEGQDVIYHYNQTIQRLEQQGKVGTASSYESSLHSLLGYQEHKGKPIDKLSLLQVTPTWLQGYEEYMLHELGKLKI